MHLFQTIVGLRAYLSRYWQKRVIGLVPTMGALHPGHQRLLEMAREDNDIVVASIFVNPLQFAPTEDLDQYPRTLEADLQLCDRLGIDAVFAPSAIEMGTEGDSPENLTRVFPPASMISGLCGASRPGHFLGVATIVVKLLQIVQPTRAYFGEKDAQQLAIIRRLVKDLCLPVEIRPCAIARENSGLAYSSRNQYLSPTQREQARVLFRSLQKAREAFQAGEVQGQVLLDIATRELALENNVRVEYVECVHPMTLEPLKKVEESGLLAIAARVGETRLIDNIILRHRQPIIAIDGPAGVGKSTAAKRIARQLGHIYLDTGAMYRALTWRVLEARVSVEDEAAIAELAARSSLKFIQTEGEDGQKVYINDQDVTEIIRSPEVTANVSAVAKHPAVRHHLVEQQRHWGEKGGLVAEGRDIGTHVFPDAEVKIFLTASVPERARRRLQDLKDRGYGLVFQEELEAQIRERDRLDSTRKMSPLRQASDAIEVQTDGLTIEQVIQKILQYCP
ncbi:bifunctional pantoate--beta-alanine ligase/(d)CMP kinase [Spirulina sp. 06S082]|uniref:bifunctional pantoate--beta-alanine ligase/(d)CMP kinase n=1 Tax=Spirulina sp. 06S082 TaxID=3110248 RepID=UPI002B214371|nr:bifunctional pantoate--beta-alanine ligase/(d)CMP kinase [Spirulina sp. 06S082]MEA5470673.1 bifunctional pantoate--beta-alanine ligase/(d)CMP kinase [Spirulina sp. 06S082]